jgi:hypothetical protein
MSILDVQRRVTADFIASDPTTAQFIPVSRVAQSNGGFQEVDGTPRPAQTFKLSLLAYDQRPTITVAGVERVIDYHIIGPHDLQIAVGDYWIDEEGTRFDILGITEGFGYETKAYVSRHVPRAARP